MCIYSNPVQDGGGGVVSKLQLQVHFINEGNIHSQIRRGTMTQCVCHFLCYLHNETQSTSFNLEYHFHSKNRISGTTALNVRSNPNSCGGRQENEESEKRFSWNWLPAHFPWFALNVVNSV